MDVRIGFNRNSVKVTQDLADAFADLVDRIDHCYGRVDGGYGDLDALVSDKMQYIHHLLDDGKGEG